jgi:hypothetical protein
MNRVIKIVALVIFPVVWACSVSGQEIRIRVVDARNGKAINDECLNISFGSWHGGDLFAPTNSDGIVVLHLKNNFLTADARSVRDCHGLAVVGPKPLPNGVDTLALATDGEYFDCQEWAKVVPAGTPKENLNRAPSYPIKKILETGVVASNSCGKFRAEAKPGELILFLRPATLWEKMRR